MNKKETMTKKAKKALDESIELWTKKKTDFSFSPNCPLCTIFEKNRECCGCPVMRKTGKSMCYKTPFYDYPYAVKVITELTAYDQIDYYVGEWEEYCKKEIDFLKTCYY
jgi:hypothetical protein